MAGLAAQAEQKRYVRKQAEQEMHEATAKTADGRTAQQ
jgi:hypothetical protein